MTKSNPVIRVLGILIVSFFILAFWVIVASGITLGMIRILDVLLSFLSPFFMRGIGGVSLETAIQIGRSGALILGAIVWGYAAYGAFRSIRNFTKLPLNSRQQKKASAHNFESDSFADSIEQLPTKENIQQLISEDGEIPDEAFQSKHRK